MAVNSKMVYSSHVNRIIYDPEARQLSVEYKNGKTSVHKDVPHETARSVMEAPSIGKALHDHVRGKFAHSYLGDD